MNREYQMLRRVSRTFAMAIEQLPRGPRDALTLAYLLLRVSDGIEDHAALGVERKVELLELWARILDGRAPAATLVAALADLDAGNPEIAVALEAGALLERLHALPPTVREAVLPRVGETTLGMARWQRQGPRIADEAALDDYMHQVAGRVGYLITDVFAAYSASVRAQRDELMPLAREFGLGLQTVNIVRGIPTDAARGWIFVPHSYCLDVGIEPAQLFEAGSLRSALAVTDRLVAKAERHLEHGLAYIERLPRTEHRMRLMCIWPLCLAARTLALSRGNAAVLQAEAKLSRAEVYAIVRGTRLRAWSNRWLRGYLRRLNPGVAAAGAQAVGHR